MSRRAHLWRFPVRAIDITSAAAARPRLLRSSAVGKTQREDNVIKNPVPWPNGARCAVAFTFDLDADSILHLSFAESAGNRVAGLSRLRYGPQVAVPRIVDAFARYGMKQTFFVPAWCIEQYPQAVETILGGGHEIAHHGYIHENPNKLTPDEEERWLVRGIDVIVKATSRRPRGYRAPNYGFSQNSLDLLAKHGFAYDASLMGDDVPYVLQGEAGSVLELPSDITLDDWPHFMSWRDFGYMMPISSPGRANEVFRAEFDAMWDHGGLWISVWHPFVMGRLARCSGMIELIDYMHRKGDVWFARLDEITDHVGRCIADGSWKPRIDRLPYYTAPLQNLPANPAQPLSMNAAARARTAAE